MESPDKAKYLKFKFTFDPYSSLGNVKVQKRNDSIHSQFIARSVMCHTLVQIVPYNIVPYNIEKLSENRMISVTEIPLQSPFGLIGSHGDPSDGSFKIVPTCL